MKVNFATALDPMSGLSRVRCIIRSIFVYVVALYIMLMTAYFLLRIFFGDGVWWLSFTNSLAHLLFLPLLLLFPISILLHRKSALRLLPVVLIGIFWFAPYLSSKRVDMDGNTALRIVTFNVWGDNSRLDAVEDWIRTVNADVVLLQEIPEEYSVNGIPGLQDMYSHQYVQSLESREWGNATLSRIPFLMTEEFDLEGDGTPSHQRITLDWRGQTIAIYNIHLLMPIGDTAHVVLPISNPFLNLALKYDDTLRNNEIRELLKRLHTESNPFLVAGDFNTSDQSVIYSQLTKRMHDTFMQVGIGFGASWPVPIADEFPKFIPPLIRVDYIWHSDHFAAIAAEQGPPLGSDHLPLVATLAFR